MDENRSNVEAVAIRGDRIQVIGAGIDHAWKLADTARYYPMRSEERRVGKECRSRWSPYH